MDPLGESVFRLLSVTQLSPWSVEVALPRPVRLTDAVVP